MWPNNISGLGDVYCHKCNNHRLLLGVPGINNNMSDKAIQWMRYRVRSSELLVARSSSCPGCLKVAKMQVKVLGMLLSKLEII